MDVFIKFNGKINRRSPRNEGKPEEPWLRENFISRDGKLTRVKGTQKAIDELLPSKPTWMGRYYSVETGVVAPKTFAYTQDGKIWLINDEAGARSATEVASGLNENAYPRHWLFKTLTTTTMYLADGRDLWKHDGNNDHKWEKVDVTDADEKSINPIDVIEHRDRLWLISETQVFVSKNLFPEIFDDATDSINIIVGSGRGKNKALRKLEDRLFIFNTEGIFVIVGDTISALAITFEVRLVDEKRIIAGRTATKVENAIVFLADDLNVWSWNGNTSTKLSHSEKLEDFVNPIIEQLERATAIYYDNFFMLSFVETGTPNTIEVWWDALESKIDFVRGRNIASYLEIDPTREETYLQFGRSDVNRIMWADRSNAFDNEAIVSRLWTRDIVMNKGRNVRITRFYVSYEMIGEHDLVINYWLDGRLSPPTGTNPSWTQRLQGEVKTLGQIKIKNQSQTTDVIRPQIAHSRGESLGFYINDGTLNMRITLLGIGFDATPKFLKKGRTIGK